MTKKALGKGLKALITDTPRVRAGFADADINTIRPNPDQPRGRFDDDALRALSESIREHGVLQPLLVSEVGPGRYQILAGERRWRAARAAGLKQVPVVIRERVTEIEALEIALVENLQRRDLTPLEEARAYENLRAERGLSQAAIAQRVGFDRSTVANSLRLLKLPPEVQKLIEDGQLSAGHARALLMFQTDELRIMWAREAASEGFSVRHLERCAANMRDTNEGPKPTRRRTHQRDDDPNLRQAEDRLRRTLGAPVEIKRRGKTASIMIKCLNENELMRIFDLMVGSG